MVFIAVHVNAIASISADEIGSSIVLNKTVYPWENGGKIQPSELRKNLAVLQKQWASSQISMAHVYIGLSYGLSGILDKALAEYSIAIKKDPFNAVAYIGKGDVYWRKKLWEDALKIYQEGAGHSPENIIYKRLVESYDKKGQDNGVLKVLNNWFSVDPQNPYIHLKLGLWYEKAGKKQEALKEYGRISLGSVEYYEALKGKMRLGVSPEMIGFGLEEKPLVYEQKSRRDPFEPLWKIINPLVVDIDDFSLTGIFESDKGTAASFKLNSKPLDFYFLKNGELLTRDNKKVPDVTGIIENKEVTLMQGEKETIFKINEKEE